ncbi:MAG TPA: alpha-ketoacid dehydrogenase subunit beta [Candidatus Saccharimonadales bacterium]|nr:alpha-ketoacid dehydrogenase subunit beta [Candidatus Saccharimonadales bacterium]
MTVAPELNMVEAINRGLGQILEEDQDSLLIGEDIGANGGVFRATIGLQERFGEERVIDTPLSEAGFVGAALGMCLVGLHPVVEIQFDAFVYPAVEQLVSQVARFRWRTRGAYGLPLVIRLPYGGGTKAPELHSDSPETLFSHVPGLRVVIPSDALSAGELLLAAISYGDPIVFMEPKRMYRRGRQAVPERFEPGDLDHAIEVRPGSDLTVIAYGAMIEVAQAAAEQLQSEGVSTRVLDLRSIYPLDRESILAAAEETGRVLVVHEAPRHCGVGAEVAALLQEEVADVLLAPTLRVTGMDMPFPLSQNEDDALPTVERVIAAVHSMLEY